MSGITLSGAGGLAAIPIFDFAGYNEAAQYHYQWFRFAVRDRLIAANGGARNHVMWRAPSTTLQVPEDAIAKMDWWMLAYRTDPGAGTPIARVIRNRPVDLVDSCGDRDNPGTRIAEPQVFGRLPTSRCNAMWPSFSDPRQVAGGPLSAAILKCQLKPIEAASYQAKFSILEVSQLRQVFPHGVCDWSKSGVSQTKVLPWTSFGPSTVNPISKSH